MPRFIILIAIVLIALVLWYKIKNAKGDQRKKMIFWRVVGAIVGTLFVLAATGKLNWLTALLGGIAAMIPRLLGYAKYLPFISRLYAQTRQQQHQQHQQARQNNKGISKEEALDILGLKPGASKDEILAAHKRMMQKVHPDRGGSDNLAAQINKAKDTLLG